MKTIEYNSIVVSHQKKGLAGPSLVLLCYDKDLETCVGMTWLSIVKAAQEIPQSYIVPVSNLKYEGKICAKIRVMHDHTNRKYIIYLHK